MSQSIIRGFFPFVTSIRPNKMVFCSIVFPFFQIEVYFLAASKRQASSRNQRCLFLLPHFLLLQLTEYLYTGLEAGLASPAEFEGFASFRSESTMFKKYIYSSSVGLVFSPVLFGLNINLLSQKFQENPGKCRKRMTAVTLYFFVSFVHLLYNTIV